MSVKKLDDCWRLRGDFLLFAGQPLELTGGTWHVAVRSRRCARRLLLSLKDPQKKKSPLSQPGRTARIYLVSARVSKNVGKVVGWLQRAGRAPREGSLDSGGRRRPPPLLLRLVLLGRRNVLSRSLRPLLCFRQVSDRRQRSARPELRISISDALKANPWVGG